MESIGEHHQAIGLYGGTFNPVHVGHLRVAEEMREQFHLDRVVFIPSFQPPHKSGCHTPAAHRLAMVQAAVAANEWFVVSDVEIQRAGPSYACETIRHFRRWYGNRAELFFIVGSDAFEEIATWHAYPEFFALCHFVVMSRPGCAISALPPELAGRYTRHSATEYRSPQGCRLIFCSVTGLDVSSTDIRRRVTAGASIRYLVPDTVAQYINQHGVYAAGPS